MVRRPERVAEEALWKAFWQNEGGIAPNDVMYRRALRQVEQLDALQVEITNRNPKVLGLVIDEVDERLHNERSKADVAYWLGRWLRTGFVERLFAFLLGEGFSIYVTADHGNVDATGVGRPNQGVIAESRGERVRVYRSESLRADSAVAYPGTISLDIAGLPANFMPLFAGGRSAFVAEQAWIGVRMKMTASGSGSTAIAAQQTLAMWMIGVAFGSFVRSVRCSVSVTSRVKRAVKSMLRPPSPRRL